MMQDAQKQIGAFLRSKREALAPELYGLSRPSRARTPGLRREDVAEMAGISTVWYSKIERGKAGGISREALNSLANALQFDETERHYVMALAGIEASTSLPGPCVRVSQDTTRLLVKLNPLPAILINDYFDILATNAAYDVMCGVVLGNLPREDCNYVGLILTNPAWRRFLQLIDDRMVEERVARLVGTLRGMSAGRPGDTTLEKRIAWLRELSPIFARCWERKNVARREEALFSFTHATLGPITLKKQIWLNCSGETSGQLNVYHPQNENDYNHLAKAVAS
ncbi:helix-turn-helix transcriptional regulator [Thalassospira sp. TSL5-1]|uniref:helix-turn-helix transcriptional regulator n=1 Tax=Thalassospira sp. TSL5-1 TaxID=1544451 RepID=UPI000938B4C6|nr:helix-turn-helix transcriptional regulator [Thalassospira sp. TSL5-1]OKH86859.1 DNA-binding protein [Thalassospira sp. TSL5-1]